MTMIRYSKFRAAIEAIAKELGAEKVSFEGTSISIKFPEGEGEKVHIFLQRLEAETKDQIQYLGHNKRSLH